MNVVNKFRLVFAYKWNLQEFYCGCYSLLNSFGLINNVKIQIVFSLFFSSFISIPLFFEFLNVLLSTNESRRILPTSISLKEISSNWWKRNLESWLFQSNTYFIDHLMSPSIDKKEKKRMRSPLQLCVCIIESFTRFCLSRYGR